MDDKIHNYIVYYAVVIVVVVVVKVSQQASWM